MTAAANDRPFARVHIYRPRPLLEVNAQSIQVSSSILSTGHVALSLHNNKEDVSGEYISFWKDCRFSKRDGTPLCHKPGSHLHTQLEDQEIETRESGLTHTYYDLALDVSAIRNSYTYCKLKNKNVKWTLFGSGPFQGGGR